MSSTSNKTKRMNKGLAPMRSLLTPILKNKKLARQNFHILLTLWENWDKITDGLTAQDATPVKIKYPHKRNNNAVLTIATRPANKLLISHETHLLCQNINAIMGQDAVGRIDIIDAPSQHQTSYPTNQADLKKLLNMNKKQQPPSEQEQQAAAQKFTHVTDETLRTTLTELYLAVEKKNR